MGGRARADAAGGAGRPHLRGAQVVPRARAGVVRRGAAAARLRPRVPRGPREGRGRAHAPPARGDGGGGRQRRAHRRRAAAAGGRDALPRCPRPRGDGSARRRPARGGPGAALALDRGGDRLVQGARARARRVPLATHPRVPRAARRVPPARRDRARAPRAAARAAAPRLLLAGRRRVPVLPLRHAGEPAALPRAALAGAAHGAEGNRLRHRTAARVDRRLPRVLRAGNVARVARRRRPRGRPLRALPAAVGADRVSLSGGRGSVRQPPPVRRAHGDAPGRLAPAGRRAGGDRRRAGARQDRMAHGHERKQLLSVHLLEEMSTPALDALDRAPTVVLLTVSPLETHGPHLPVGVDAFTARHFAETIAERLVAARPGWSAVLAPTLHLGSFTFESVGTVAVRQRVVRDALVDYGAAFARAGFRYILIANGHGGPGHLTALEEAAETVSRRCGVTMASFTGHLAWQFMRGRYADKIEAALGRPLSDEERAAFADDAHGGWWETSLMLLLRPELVDESFRTLPPARYSWPERVVPNYALRNGGRGYVGHPALADPAFRK